MLGESGASCRACSCRSSAPADFPSAIKIFPRLDKASARVGNCSTILSKTKRASSNWPERLRRNPSASSPARFPAADSTCSAERIWLKTVRQSPGVGWRKIRMVGYHGLSARLWSQRHSPAKGSSSQTGLPSAPAKCAVAVSTLMTRSSCSMIAAVAAKSVQCAAASVALAAWPSAAAASAGALSWRLTKWAQSDASSAWQSSHCIERKASLRCCGFPAQAMPTLSLSGGRPSDGDRCDAPRYGT